jgi:mycothiol synthase
MGTTEGWPAGIEARPIEKADASAWADLLAAKEKADQQGENYDADDLLEELDDPKLIAATDTIGLWSQGQMVGYGSVHAPSEAVDVHRVWTEATVRPDWRGRGLGTALTLWLNHRGAELHQERLPETVGEINASAISTNTGAHELLTGLGYTEVRYFFQMERPFDPAVPVPTVDPPLGLRVVGFDPSYDEATRLTHNEVFRDHWGSTPRDADAWKVWFTGSRSFRGNLSQLVLDGDEIVAYALGYEHVADTESTGIREVYVGQVGTRRSYRGRGLAGVALSALMAEAERTGFQRSSLGVDAENPTGALGLYKKLGFQVRIKTIAYRCPIE